MVKDRRNGMAQHIKLIIKKHTVSGYFPVQTSQGAREDIKESFEMKIDEKHISLFPIFMNSATLY